LEARALALPKKSHQLVDRLLQYISTGKWTIGMRLPPERTLASSHKVSRAAVREALSALQLAGYIDTRVGDGSYVASVPKPDFERDRRTVLAGIGITETLEAREALEVACVRLAVRKATRADIARLNRKMRGLSTLVARGELKDYLLATLDFHLEVAAAAHNPFLQNAVAELIERHRNDQWLLHERYTPQTAQISLRMHAAIADAIGRKDLSAAVAAVTKHYDHYPLLSASTHRGKIK
jgi:DNA-binding FadR family transcriptional regulator